MNVKNTIQREPVGVATVVRVVTYGLALLVTLGYVTQEQQEAALRFMVAAIPLVEVALLWYQRQRVTPVASPFDDNGVPLVPVTYVADEPDIASNSTQ